MHVLNVVTRGHILGVEEIISQYNEPYSTSAVCISL